MINQNQERVKKQFTSDFYIDFLRGNFLESLKDFFKSLGFMVYLSRIPKSYLSHELPLMERLRYCEDFWTQRKLGAVGIKRTLPQVFYFVIIYFTSGLPQ